MRRGYSSSRRTFVVCVASDPPSMPRVSPVEFWTWLAAQEDRLGWPPESDLVDEIGDRLGTIHPGLEFELAKADPPLLSISAAGDPSLFDLVRDIVAHAPTSLPIGVVAFRQRGPIAGAVLNLPNGGSLSADDVWFRMENADEAEVGLHVYVRDFPAEGQGAWQEAVYLLLDNALGEEDVVTMITWIEWAPLPSDPGPQGLRPLEDLAAAFDLALGRPRPS
jgi:hypothetical protein